MNEWDSVQTTELTLEVIQADDRCGLWNRGDEHDNTRSSALGHVAVELYAGGPTMACSLVELSEAVDENATRDASAKQCHASTLRFAHLYSVHLFEG